MSIVYHRSVVDSYRSYFAVISSGAIGIAQISLLRYESAIFSLVCRTDFWHGRRKKSPFLKINYEFFTQLVLTVTWPHFFFPRVWSLDASDACASVQVSLLLLITSYDPDSMVCFNLSWRWTSLASQLDKRSHLKFTTFLFRLFWSACSLDQLSKMNLHHKRLVKMTRSLTRQLFKLHGLSVRVPLNGLLYSKPGFVFTSGVLLSYLPEFKWSRMRADFFSRSIFLKHEGTCR